MGGRRKWELGISHLGLGWKPLLRFSLFFFLPKLDFCIGIGIRNAFYLLSKGNLILRSGGPAAGRAPARGQDRAIYFSWRKKKKKTPRLGFLFFFYSFFLLCPYTYVQPKKKRFSLQPLQKGWTSYNLLSCPPNHPFFYVLYIHIAHTQTHSDDYAHSIIHKSFRVYLGNIRPSTRYYVCMIPAALHTI